MVVALIVLLSVILYPILVILYGGKYSFSMQEIKSLSKTEKLEKADKGRVRQKIEFHVNRIPINKKRGYIGAIIILIGQLTANYLIIDDILLYIIVSASFAICILSFLIVYWLKGSGTIDGERRMHGGMRI